MRRPTIAVDLDGVLAEYTGWKGIDHFGDPIPGAVEFTKKLSGFAKVMIYTTRCKAYPADSPGPEGQPEPDRSSVDALVGKVTAWLDKHGFAYDSVYAGQGKPFAMCYVDDRAVSCVPQKFGPSELTHAADICLEMCEEGGWLKASELALGEQK